MLVDGHRNFGNIEGYGAAAMRYTESRLSKISLELLRDIGKNTVDFEPNFDESENEPKILPADMTMGYLKLSQRDLQRFQNTLAQVSDCSKQVFRVLSTGYASQIADEFGVKCFNTVITVPELKSENLSMGFEIPDNLDLDDVDPLTVWCNVKTLDSIPQGNKVLCCLTR